MFFNANFGHMANMTKEEAGRLMFDELKERLEDIKKRVVVYTLYSQEVENQRKKYRKKFGVE